MKELFLMLVFTCLFVADISAQKVQNVNAIKFKELIGKSDAIIIDVRTPGEYSRGHIKGSTSINISDPGFASRIGLIQKNKPILIYCLSGSRSNAAANYMSKMGFGEIINLEQGLMDWNRQGYELEQSKDVVASAGIVYTEQSFGKLTKDNKLVLVDFHAVWCAPCKAMNPVIDKITASFKDKARVEKVDIEANKLIATACQVQSVPGFVIFRDGKIVWRHNGAISYEDLSAVITKYL